MPRVVVRLYPESGDLISKIRERESEVREIMGGVPGLVTYGLAETAGGAFSITVCEDQAGTDESTRRAAAWIKANMPDAQFAPPRVLEGEGVWVVQGKVDESQPHLVMRLFSQPPPDMVRQAEADVRGLLADVPGFRLCSVTDCGNSGMNLLVCDDKTGTDECVSRLNAFYERRGLVAPTAAEVFEADGVLRIRPDAVPA